MPLAGWLCSLKSTAGVLLLPTGRTDQKSTTQHACRLRRELERLHQRRGERAKRWDQAYR